MGDRHAERPGALHLAAKTQVIAAATAAACDGLDGIKDGVIDDPRQCRFDRQTIQCKAGDAADYLTAPTSRH